MFRFLVQRADVLIDPFRPGVLEGLGLAPSDLLKLNPRLVVVRITGYADGRYARMAGHDINYLALSGVLSTLGRSEAPPTPPGNLLADFAGGGLMAVVGVLAALLERSQSGQGQVVEAVMQEGATYLATFIHIAQKTPLWNQARGANLLDSGAPFYDCYKTADGEWMACGALEPRFYRVFVSGLGLENELPLNKQHDRACWPRYREIIAARFLEHPQSHWIDVFADTDACVTPVLSLSDAVKASSSNGSEVLETPLPAPRLSRTPATLGGLGTQLPLDGEHSKEILQEFGFPDARIEELLSSKVVVQGRSRKKLAKL